ncbi:MAG: Maf family protein [Candidatus Magasanikbacteria bacterium]
MKIILGSQSKSRRKIMENMGYNFESMNPNIDEKAIRFDDPKQLTLALAHAKADALLPKISEPSLLVTSDQVVTWNGNILEKPENEEEARKFLQGYAIYPPTTVTSIVVVNTVTMERREGIDIATVWFRTIPENIINELISEGDILYCAGGFQVENPKLKDYIEKIEGTIDSIMGLPKKMVQNFIQEIEK